MNYRDYKEIMEAEQLQESEAVRYYLGRAAYWQKAIKRLEQYDNAAKQRLLPKFMNTKISFIWQAIDIARFEKEIGFKINEESDQYFEYLANKRAAELAKA